MLDLYDAAMIYSRENIEWNLIETWQQVDLFYLIRKAFRFPLGETQAPKLWWLKTVVLLFLRIYQDGIIWVQFKATKKLAFASCGMLRNVGSQGNGASPSAVRVNRFPLFEKGSKITFGYTYMLVLKSLQGQQFLPCHIMLYFRKTNRRMAGHGWE